MTQLEFREVMPFERIPQHCYRGFVSDGLYFGSLDRAALTAWICPSLTAHEAERLGILADLLTPATNAAAMRTFIETWIGKVRRDIAEQSTEV